MAPGPAGPGHPRRCPRPPIPERTRAVRVVRNASVCDRLASFCTNARTGKRGPTNVIGPCASSAALNPRLAMPHTSDSFSAASFTMPSAGPRPTVKRRSTSERTAVRDDQSSDAAAASRSGKAASAAPAAGSGCHASTSANAAARLASTVFVAATLRSGPASMSSTSSQADASGDAGSFTTASVSAPPARACSAEAIRSGLRPDCDMATKSAPRRRCGQWYTDASDGIAAAATRPSRWASSIRRNVPTWEELPRAHVTANGGSSARSRDPRAAKASCWDRHRRTASPASSVSARMKLMPWHAAPGARAGGVIGMVHGLSARRARPRDCRPATGRSVPPRPRHGYPWLPGAHAASARAGHSPPRRSCRTD